jgi:hypothetical protein
MAALVTALIAAFIPGASPPDVRTPIVLIFAICFRFMERKGTKSMKIYEFICTFVGLYL